LRKNLKEQGSIVLLSLAVKLMRIIRDILGTGYRAVILNGLTLDEPVMMEAGQ